MTDREIATLIWMKVKGNLLPEYYTEEDCKSIIYRYWYNAAECG